MKTTIASAERINTPISNTKAIFHTGERVAGSNIILGSSFVETLN